MRTPGWLGKTAILALLAAAARPGHAAQVDLSWDPNVEADLSGYRLYHSAGRSLLGMTPAQATQTPGVQVAALGAAATSHGVSGLQEGNTYYFRLTAVDTAGNESSFNVDAAGQEAEVSRFLPAAPVHSPVEPDPTTCEGYPERRIFLEAQGWWVPMAGQTGTNNGHVHSGTCFPWSGFGQSLSGTVRFDVRVVMHMNPGVLKHVKVQASTDGSAVELAALQPNFQCAQMTCVQWYTLYADTTKLPADGRVEFRIHAHVQNPDGTRLFSSTGWQARVANGGGRPIVNYPRTTDTFTEGRGWYGFNGPNPPDLGYQNARLADPLPIDPVSGVWSPSIVLDAGSGGEPPTSHMATIDPNFHEGNRGTVIKEGAGSFRGRISIDTTRLADGPHKLVLRTDFVCEPATEPTLCAAPDRNATQSGLLVIPFTVANGGSPPPTPAPDTTPPTVSITAPGAGAEVSGSVNVAAGASDNVGVAKVELFVDGSLKASDASAPYAFAWDTTQVPDGAHTLLVKARDAAGNVAQASVEVTVRNAPPADTAPPAISNVAASVDASGSVAVSWNTDEAADSQVEYGPTITYGQASALNPTLFPLHIVVLNGLTPGTLYHYRVKSRDAAGNLAVSGDFTFTTPAAPAPPPITGTGPLLDGLSCPEEVNAWQEDLRVRVRALAGSSAVEAVELVHTEVGGGGFSLRQAMTLEAGGGGFYAAVVPPAFTALKAGPLDLRVEARDAAGRRATGGACRVRVENYIEAAPDAQGIVRFPHRLVSGGATEADFSALRPEDRPALVRIRLLPPALHAASREAEIDRRVNGGLPLAAYEITTPGARTFGRAVRLVLAYRDPESAPGSLGVFHHDGVQWRLMSLDEDALRRTASARTTHFSKFAVFAVDEAALRTAEALRSKERFITPSLRDGINDQAVFGLEARSVEIFDLTGRKVFSASGAGGPLSWDGRDPSGRVVESGAYVAKITDAGGGRYYQIIVVAK